MSNKAMPIVRMMPVFFFIILLLFYILGGRESRGKKWVCHNCKLPSCILLILTHLKRLHQIVILAQPPWINCVLNPNQSIILDNADHIEEEATIYFGALFYVSALDVIDIHDRVLVFFRVGTEEYLVVEDNRTLRETSATIG